MKILIIFLFGITLITCTNTDDAIEFSCYKDENRKVIATFNDVKGTIIGPSINSCQTLFTIKDESNEYTLAYGPCNLDEKFKVDGLDVVFSGYLFETFELEDICALPFELTKIDKLIELK